MFRCCLAPSSPFPSYGSEICYLARVSLAIFSSAFHSHLKEDMASELPWSQSFSFAAKREEERGERKKGERKGRERGREKENRLVAGDANLTIMLR